ncbi:acyltransferase family protein [Mesorhizobium sp. M1406]|uniref:acyltransferase family protein n=1 Tax=Mesorhizobium sp. M1406 TaxID=2957099 RepID=UPI00333AC656
MISNDLNGSSYFRFVDGLRAIAVTSVIFYHLNVPYVSGGYVGVDIFFVISGFLIINQILYGLKDGSFSFSDFWSRRALRILPPYLLVVLTSAIVALHVLVLPSEFEEFGQEVLHSAGMVANQLFLNQQGYFDTESGSKILLHLWSLAVEEQFYLFAPLLLWLACRLRISIPGLGVVVAITSLAGCIYYTGTGITKNYAFYLMPFRAWEFVVGGAILGAVPYLQRLPAIAIEVIGVLGFVLIAYAVFYFNSQTPFPSYWATLPAVGTAMVIGAGVALRRGIGTWWLATPPMVGIGVVSYAWYLWHWPALALARIYNFGNPSPKWMAAVGVLSFVLAICTHIWIERPILTWRREKGKYRLGWYPAINGVVACIIASIAGLGFVYLAPKIVVNLSPLLASIEPYPSNGMACNLGVIESTTACLTYLDGKRPILVFGDSHAGVSYGAIEDAYHNPAMAGLMLPNCPSIFDIRVVGFDATMEANCVDLKSRGLAQLETDVHAKSAILISLWTMYGKWSGEPGPGEQGRFLAEVGADAPAPAQRDFYQRKLTETIEKLHSLGVERIALFAPVPEMPRFAPDCVVRALRYGFDVDELCSVTQAASKDRRTGAMQLLDAVAAQFPYVRIIDPVPAMCDDTWCRPYRHTTILYRDINHLLPAGVRAVIDANRETFDWVMGSK